MRAERDLRRGVSRTAIISCLVACLLIGTSSCQTGWSFYLTQKDTKFEADSVTSVAVLNYKNATLIYAAIYKVASSGSGSSGGSSQGGSSGSGSGYDPEDRGSGDGRGSGGSGSGLPRYDYYLVVRDSSGNFFDIISLSSEMPYLSESIVEGGSIVVYGPDSLQRFKLAESGEFRLVAFDPKPIPAFGLKEVISIPYDNEHLVFYGDERLILTTFPEKNFPKFSNYSLEIFGEKQTIGYNNEYLVRFAHTQKTLYIHKRSGDSTLEVIKKFEYGKISSVKYTHIHVSVDSKSIYCFAASEDGTFSAVTLDFGTLMPRSSSVPVPGEVHRSVYLPTLNLFGAVIITGEGSGIAFFKTDEKGDQLVMIPVLMSSNPTSVSNMVEWDGRYYTYGVQKTSGKWFSATRIHLDPSRCLTSELTPGITCKQCRSMYPSRCSGTRGELPKTGMGLDVENLSYRPCADPDCRSCAQNYRICTACVAGKAVSFYTKTCYDRSTQPLKMTLSDAVTLSLTSSTEEQHNDLSNNRNYLMMD